MAVLVAFYFVSPARVVEVVTLNPEHMRVIDADTIALEGTSIRLKGVAAPEKGHPKFVGGKTFLGRLLRQANSVTCNLTAERSYDRRIGRCFFSLHNGKTVDIQRSVIAEGFARGCPRFGGWRYWLDETPESRLLPFPSYCWGISPH